MKIIYGLFDPRDWEKPVIKYVGQSQKLIWRFNNHCQDPRRCGLGDWVIELRKINLIPAYAVLEIVEDDWVDVAERKWINRFPRGSFLTLRGSLHYSLPNLSLWGR